MFKLYDRIRHWFKERHIRRMVRKCEELKFQTGKQQFLIYLNTGKLVIVNRRYIDAFNKMYAGKARKMEYIDLCKIAIYKTK